MREKVGDHESEVIQRKARRTPQRADDGALLLGAAKKPPTHRFGNRPRVGVSRANEHLMLSPTGPSRSVLLEPYILGSPTRLRTDPYGSAMATSEKGALSRLSPIRFPCSPEWWRGDEALQAEAQAPQAPRE